MSAPSAEQIADHLVVAAGRGVDERRPARPVHRARPRPAALHHVEVAAERRDHQRSVADRVARHPDRARGEQHVHRRAGCPRARRSPARDRRSRSTVFGSMPRASMAFTSDAVVGDGEEKSSRSPCARAARAAAARHGERGGGESGDSRRAATAINGHRVVLRGDPEQAEEIGGRRARDGLDRTPRAGARSPARRAARTPARCACRGAAPGRGRANRSRSACGRAAPGAATSFSACAFLNVTMPENEMWKPRSSAAAATSQRLGEAMHDAAGVAGALLAHDRERVVRPRRGCGRPAACRPRAPRGCGCGSAARCQSRSPVSR